MMKPWKDWTNWKHSSHPLPALQIYNFHINHQAGKHLQFTLKNKVQFLNPIILIQLCCTSMFTNLVDM